MGVACETTYIPSTIRHMAEYIRFNGSGRSPQMTLIIIGKIYMQSCIIIQYI